MQQRRFGTTGLHVSALGFGAGQIGDASLPEQNVATLLHTAVDMGITLFDTARGYGVSEQRLGLHLNHCRNDLIISTKIGYSIAGTEDWSPACISKGIEEALVRLKIDYIDIVHLHSCPSDTLKNAAVIDALKDAKTQGKIRLAAYAGENEALEQALHSQDFDSLLMSVNVFDQRFIDQHLWNAKQQGLGIIAKRPIANAPWRFKTQPVGDYAEEYWLRWQTMGLDFDLDWQEIAIRFAAFTYGVDSIIVGTTNATHLKSNVEYLSKGPLDEQIVNAIRARFRECDQAWLGQL